MYNFLSKCKIIILLFENILEDVQQKLKQDVFLFLKELSHIRLPSSIKKYYKKSSNDYPQLWIFNPIKHQCASIVWTVTLQISESLVLNSSIGFKCQTVNPILKTPKFYETCTYKKSPLMLLTGNSSSHTLIFVVLCFLTFSSPFFWSHLYAEKLSMRITWQIEHTALVLEEFDLSTHLYGGVLIGQQQCFY